MIVRFGNPRVRTFRSIRVDGGYGLSQTPHKGFGDIYVKESNTPVFTGWGTSDQDVEALGFAQPFQDIMKEYVKIGKDKKNKKKEEERSKL